jgi:hypothetical protein
VLVSLMTSVALVATMAQAADPQPNDQPTGQADIAAARSTYLRAEGTPGKPSSDEDELAQFRRPARRPAPGRSQYPRRAQYPTMWREGDGRRTAIGALIGFGLGAAMGAKVNSDNHQGAGVRAALVFGTFGGLFGAAIGHGIQPLPRTRRYRSNWPSDEELGALPHASTQPAASLSLATPPPSPEGDASRALSSENCPIRAEFANPRAARSISVDTGFRAGYHR